jgi:hypothetical protein
MYVLQRVFGNLMGRIHTIVEGMKRTDTASIEEISEVFWLLYLSGLVDQKVFDTEEEFVAFKAIVLDPRPDDVPGASYMLGLLCIHLGNVMSGPAYPRRLPQTFADFRERCYEFNGYSSAVVTLSEVLKNSEEGDRPISDFVDFGEALLPLLRVSGFDEDSEYPDTRAQFYTKVAAFAASLISDGRSILLDVQHDPKASDDDWKLVFVLTHDTGESTFLLYPDDRCFHLSTTRGEKVDLKSFDNFRSYVRDFF